MSLSEIGTHTADIEKHVKSMSTVIEKKSDYTKQDPAKLVEYRSPQPF